MRSNMTPKENLCLLADVPVAAISSPWDLPQKILVTFFRCLGKGERRPEACSLSVDQRRVHFQVTN